MHKNETFLLCHSAHTEELQAVRGQAFYNNTQLLSTHTYVEANPFVYIYAVAFELKYHTSYSTLIHQAQHPKQHQHSFHKPEKGEATKNSKADLTYGL